MKSKKSEIFIFRIFGVEDLYDLAYTEVSVKEWDFTISYFYSLFGIIKGDRFFYFKPRCYSIVFDYNGKVNIG